MEQWRTSPSPSSSVRDLNTMRQTIRFRLRHPVQATFKIKGSSSHSGTSTDVRTCFHNTPRRGINMSVLFRNGQELVAYLQTFWFPRAFSADIQTVLDPPFFRSCSRLALRYRLRVCVHARVQAHSGNSWGRLLPNSAPSAPRQVLVDTACVQHLCVLTSS